jgi:hypothetical protein
MDTFQCFHTVLLLFSSNCTNSKLLTEMGIEIRSLSEIEPRSPAPKLEVHADKEKYDVKACIP